MIKPEELRKNNLVNRKYFNPHPISPEYLFEPCKVLAIKENGSLTVKIKGGKNINLKEYYPIQLTEEILIKAGFEKDDSGMFSIFIDEEEDVFYGVMNFIGFAYYVDRYDKNPLIYVKYLHQLQNLFYSLTGTELKISI